MLLFPGHKKVLMRRKKERNNNLFKASFHRGL
jgi:hypothetical protein